MKPLASKRKLIKVLDGFSRSRVLVLGDLMIDHFIRGNVTRISPEAPVPVVSITSESLRLGGAANVVHNVRALGGTVYASGVVGDDEMGREVVQRFRDLGVDTEGTIISSKYRTTVKTRVIAHHQQVVRFDREVISPLDSGMNQKVIRYLQKCLPHIDAVVISDYGKSVISQELVEATLALSKANGTPVMVDPKVKNISLYKGVRMITPNQKEAGEAVGISIFDDHDASKAALLLQEKLHCESVLITRGDHGMTLLEPDASCTHIPTLATEVYDVTGAGDTVISVLALALASDASPKVSAFIANFAAGIVVRKLGTAVVEIEELKKTIQRANSIVTG